MTNLQNSSIAATDTPASSSTPTPASSSVAAGVSNPHLGSNVNVAVANTTLSWEVQNNAYNDTLPVIPSESRVDHGRILYRLKIKAILRTLAGGDPVVGKAVAIQSNRESDMVTVSPAVSDASGVIMIRLESRYSGDLQLSVTNNDITATPFSISLRDAWYESTFLITGYNVCDEADFSGALIDGSGLGDQHRYNFLYSASGVVMQGTGRALNGRYVRFVSMGNTTWHHNSAGHRDHIETPSAVTFSYTDGVHGSFGSVLENRSIAVDPRVIPPHAHVNIEAVGDRYADDRGSAISNCHIDNFLGAGAAVVQTWLHGSVNGTHRKVKFILG